MSEQGGEAQAESSPGYKEQLSGNTKKVYCQILGLEKFPNSPGDMPENVFLPPGAIGDFENSILTTYEKGKEVGQIINWDEKKQSFAGGVVLRGSAKNTSWFEAAHFVLPAILNRMPLLSYHTHSYPDWFHSARDIAISMRRPTGFIDLVGDSHGGSALLRTEGSSIKPSPLLCFIFDLFTYHLPMFLTERRFKKSDCYHHLAELAEKEGFAFYFWRSSVGHIQPGEMKKGLNLYRIHPDENKAS